MDAGSGGSRHRCLPRGRERLRRRLADDHADLVDAIFGEIKARTQETDESVPSRKGPWWYVSRTVEGLSYSIHCRGTSAASATEVVLLDENSHAEGEGFFELGAFEISPRHGLLAWSADLNGHEEFTLRIRDVDDGHRSAGPARRDLLRHGVVGRRALPLLHGAGPRHAPLPGVAPRGRDQAGRRRSHPRGARRALQRRAGAHPQRALHRHHQRVQHLDRCPRPAVLRSAGRAAARGRAPARRRVPAGPLGPPVRHPHQPRRARLQSGERAPCDAPGIDRWSDLVPHEPGRRITQVEAFADHLVLARMVATPGSGSASLRADGSERMLAFDEPVHSVQLDANPEYTTSALRFSYESLNEPPSIYEEDVVTGERRCSSAHRCSATSTRRTTSRHASGPPRPTARRYRWTSSGAGHTSRRNGRRLALRLRGVRVLPPAVVLDRPALAPRPWRCLGPRPSARRRRAGPGLVPGRQALGQAQHVHGLHRLRGTPGARRATAPATG